MTNQNLQHQLARLLLEKLSINPVTGAVYWTDGQGDVKETEWLAVCREIRIKYGLEVMCGAYESWQTQTEWILGWEPDPATTTTK